MNIDDKRQSRELCLQLMFQVEFSGDKAVIEEPLIYFQKQFSLSMAIVSQTRSYVDGILSHRQEIDTFIEGASAHWKLSRMSLVDVNIMRLAIYECFFQKKPPPRAVAINEALEIAKKYSAKDSVQFINGVLDQVLAKNDA